MKILINDKFQYSDAPTQIISPALADKYRTSDQFPVNFDDVEKINCIGFGYTDATEIYIRVPGEYGEYDEQTILVDKEYPYCNGLYLISEINSDALIIAHNGSYIGRVAGGEYRTIGVSVNFPFGFYSTNENRTTKSGQPIPGSGGYFGRAIEADTRYKIDETIYEDILAAYESQIMRGYPYFIMFDDEQHKLPATMLHFYARTDKPISMLQSQIYRFLYSYKFKFEEAF